jgi:arsenate reductase
MWPLATVAALFYMGGSLTSRVGEADVGPAFYPEVQRYIQQRIREFDQVSDERKGDLKKIAQFVQEQNKAGKPAHLLFICTHNSRRSHMAQIWAAVGATHYGIHGLETFSGGTEATAFNPRAIAAIERAGLKVERVEGGKNPRYSVRFQHTNQALICFSKVYGDSPNPKQGFCAVMTCSQADKACPLVQGCLLRVAIPYDDPKTADDTPEERTKYDERCAQIAREMLFLFSQVKK